MAVSTRTGTPFGSVATDRTCPGGGRRACFDNLYPNARTSRRGRAQIPDSQPRQFQGIMYAGLADFDDFPGDEFRDRVAAILQSESHQRLFVGGNETADLFGTEGNVLQDAID